MASEEVDTYLIKLSAGKYPALGVLSSSTDTCNTTYKSTDTVTPITIFKNDELRIIQVLKCLMDLWRILWEE